LFSPCSLFSAGGSFPGESLSRGTRPAPSEDVSSPAAAGEAPSAASAVGDASAVRDDAVAAGDDSAGDDAAADDTAVAELGVQLVLGSGSDSAEMTSSATKVGDDICDSAVFSGDKEGSDDEL